MYKKKIVLHFLSGKMKKIPKREYERFYKIERDPDPNLRLFESDFEDEDYDENGWN